MRANRPLLLCIALITVFLLAVVGVFAGQHTWTVYHEAGTPQAVVADYITAMQRGDFSKAATMAVCYSSTFNSSLADPPGDAERVKFRNTRFRVGEERVSGDSAEVTVRLLELTFPRRNVYRERDVRVSLMRIDGNWRISNFPTKYDSGLCSLTLLGREKP